MATETEVSQVASPSIQPVIPQLIQAPTRTLSSSSTLVEKNSSRIYTTTLPKLETNANTNDQNTNEVSQSPDVRLAKQLLCFFIGFTLTLVFVSRFPTASTWTVLLVIGTLVSATLLLYCLCRRFYHRHGQGQCFAQAI